MKQLILVTVLLLTSSSSLAFSKYVHKLICSTALELTSDEGRAYVKKVMRESTLSYKITRTYTKSYGIGNDFAKGCVWPDDSRRLTHIEAYEFHFINTPKAKNLYFKRDCAKHTCVNQAIQRYAIELSDWRDSNRSSQKKHRKEALLFLGHFVGDLHQPLHVGNLEDLGGNSIKDIKVDGASKSLHSIWDGNLPEEAGLKKPNAQDELVRRINADSNSRRWSTNNISGWAKESFKLARSNAYKQNGSYIRSGDTLSGDYIEKNADVIYSQVMKASVRLAYLLDQVAKGNIKYDTLK